MKFRLVLLMLMIAFATSVSAQSPFKRLPKPNEGVLKLSATTTPTSTTAWRFTGPMGGYLYPGNQVVTGLGFGWSHLTFVDSASKWYTNVSINAVAFAGGNVVPTLNPFTVMSAGVSIGVLNQLIQAGPVYNFSGKFGVFLSISVPLTN